MMNEFKGINFEDLHSPNQDLTFSDVEEYFLNKEFQYKTGLKSLGLVQIETNLYTNLALLLSDQNPFLIKVATFADKNLTRFLSRKEFSGSILKQINDILDFINIINKNTFNIEKQYRIEKSDYPSDSIREALINAIIHRDYNYNGPTLIKINQNKLEVTSFGSLMKGLNLDDLLNGIHLPRNPKLANLFYRLDLIDAYGIGIVRIFSDYENETLKPEIILTSNLFKISLPNRNSLNNLENNNLNSPTKNKINSLSNKQIELLKIFQVDKKYSSSLLKSLSNMKQSTFYKALNDLKEKGLIAQDLMDLRKDYELTTEGKIIRNSLI